MKKGKGFRPIPNAVGYQGMQWCNKLAALLANLTCALPVFACPDGALEGNMCTDGVRLDLEDTFDKFEGLKMKFWEL
jgi:hypothetical protein